MINEVMVVNALFSFRFVLEFVRFCSLRVGYMSVSKAQLHATNLVHRAYIALLRADYGAISCKSDHYNRPS